MSRVANRRRNNLVRYLKPKSTPTRNTLKWKYISSFYGILFSIKKQ